MNGGYLQAFLFLLNRPEPIRQSSLLMILATGMGDAASLIDGLKALAEESGSPWKGRVNHLQLCLEQGQRLSEALSAARGLLPDQTLIAIRVGEETGTLKEVLTDEAHRLMSQRNGGDPVRASFSTVVVWLLAVGCITLCLLSFLLVFIVPKMRKIFADFGTDLPEATQSLLGFSRYFGDFWFFLVLPVLTVSGCAAWVVVQGSLKRLSTGHLPLSQHYPRYWTPIVLRMLSLSVATRHSLESGMHSILREISPGRAATRLSASRVRTDAGYDCWQSLEMNGFLKKREVAFLESAKRTNHLDWGLIHLARTIERRRQQWTQRLVSLVQPVVILMMGLLVGFVCVAMFMPIVQLILEIPLQGQL